MHGLVELGEQLGARTLGPGGQVVATDIETGWIEPKATTHLEVRHHNAADDPLEGSGFDLVHARLVLEHLPQRHVVASKLVGALRAGGWLVLEDYDIRTMALTEPPLPAWAAVNDAVVQVLRTVATDPLYGSRLGPLLQSAGSWGSPPKASCVR